MEKRRLGRTDMDVTVLGFGGAGIAGESIENIGNVLNSALDAGINVIDTAECYEGGEKSTGNAISKRRDEFSPSANGPHRSHSTAWMFGSRPEKGRSDFGVGESA
ncbi:MAG: hypothetical protein DMF23_15405 [Verrucomicrobia bacterium]|nr:MAG: hypothetical protein DMF23_15405 [Verrucomicrobiota bacterium]